MARLSKLDLAFNACHEAAQDAERRLIKALNDFNQAAKAEQAIYSGVGAHRPLRLVPRP